jgi:hypothetical protein
MPVASRRPRAPPDDGPKDPGGNPIAGPKSQPYHTLGAPEALAGRPRRGPSPALRASIRGAAASGLAYHLSVAAQKDSVFRSVPL